MSIERERVYVVDRIEGGYAILMGDDGTRREVLVSLLPSAAREGTPLRVLLDSAGHPDWSIIRIDEDEAERRKAEAEEILDELRRRDPGGDIEL